MTLDEDHRSSSEDRPLDVLVVGAGPTGLVLAAELRALGGRLRLIDRQPDRVHESRALAIQPRTLEVLARHGLTRELVDCGNPAVQLRMHLRRRTISLRLFDLGLSDTAYPYLLFLSQAETERILGEHLARHGVLVERGAELVSIDPTEEDVTCRLRHHDGRHETVRASYVVGCDGARSTVRQRVGIAFEGDAYPQTFLLADLEVDGLEPGAAHTWMTEAGMLFFFPLGCPATWRLLAMRPPGDSDTTVTLGQLQAITHRHTGGLLRLHDPVWISDFRVQCRGASHYRAGRVFLAGDAAHVHSPAGAQGMNTGIQDAVNLGWKLALTCRGLANPALPDSYEPERAPVGRVVLDFTDRAFTIAITHNPLLRLARTQLVPRLAPLALRFAPARRAAFRTISQLGIHYRNSPITAEGPEPPRRGARSGDRLPDAHITRDAQGCWLHEALAGKGFHLLLCGPAGAWDDGRLAALRERHAGLLTVHRLTCDPIPGVLHDPSGEALARLGVTHTAHHLVRPDGHIAYRNASTSLDGVERFLAHWLPSTPGRRG
ncbi:MAG TPA: FAD-dependent monooxygenase [Actinomycetes bacterium]|nr:FAD-dependent monooxygenase [Actinomycetes bacterium]